MLDPNLSLRAGRSYSSAKCIYIVHKSEFFQSTYTTVLKHPPEIKKSAKWSESSSDKTMTSPATKIFFKIGPLGGFEKMRVLYVAMAKKPLSSGQKWFLR